MAFPVHRLRRLRRNELIREMVRESRFGCEDLIAPLFVVHGSGVKSEIASLKGNYHFSVDMLIEEVRELRDLGIRAVLLFGIPLRRDPLASEAYNPEGIVQRAVVALKKRVPEMVVITDVCMCEYTTHGHCGIIDNEYLHNDRSLDLIEKVTLSHAVAGADIVAPAAMLDGQISTMRGVLDRNRFDNVAIMAYSAKYASRLYDPFFRDGTDSLLKFGDKRTHQMDPANGDEAMREIATDIEEGADIVMVKPAMFYLDVVYRAKQSFRMPLAVYNVSGEYVMVKAAAEAEKMDETELRREIFSSFKRAGADLIISYHSRETAQFLSRRGAG